MRCEFWYSCQLFFIPFAEGSVGNFMIVPHCMLSVSDNPYFKDHPGVSRDLGRPHLEEEGEGLSRRAQSRGSSRQPGPRRDYHPSRVPRRAPGLMCCLSASIVYIASNPAAGRTAQARASSSFRYFANAGQCSMVCSAVSIFPDLHSHALSRICSILEVYCIEDGGTRVGTLSSNAPTTQVIRKFHSEVRV